MYILKTEQSFDSAHFLAGYQGKCRNIHGHRWRVIVEVCSETLQPEGQLRGMVTDFSDIKKDLSELADTFDHKLIIETGSMKKETLEALLKEEFAILEVPFRPTAEHFAAHFYHLLEEKGYKLHAVEVYETPNNCARFMK